MLINNKSLIKTINKLNLTDDEREKFNKISEDDRGNFLYNGKPVTGGATEEQVAQIEANTNAIGDENSGLVKEVNNIKNTELQNLNTAIQTLETLVGVDETVGDKTGLPSGDANIIASINRIDSKPSGTVTNEQINTAINNYLTEHPVQSGATTEQAAQIEANRTAIGDSSSGLIKEVNDIKNTELQNLNTAILGVNETIGNKSELPVGDANIIASINRIDSKTPTGGTGLTSEQEAKLNSIDNKVDKIDGKGLSTNDYTTEEKQTVASLKATVGDTSSGLVKDVKDLKTNGVSQDNINTAVNNYLTEHPVTGGATTEQAAQIQANKTAIGDENSGLIKGLNDIATLTIPGFTPLNEIYEFDEIDNSHMNDIDSKTNSLTDSEFLADWYDIYVGLQSDGMLVSKNIVGVDQSSKYYIYEYDFKPKKYNRTILLTSGLHSYEQSAQFGLAYFIKDLMTTPYKHEGFKYIRENVRVKVIPMLNPWGYNQNPQIYGNVNKVNPNRNFDFDGSWESFPNQPNNEWNWKGTAPFSEQETKNMANWLYYNKEIADFWIDCHTGNGYSDHDVWCLYQSYNPLKSKIETARRKLVNRIKSKYGVSSVDDFAQIDHVTGLKIQWATSAVKIPTMVLEQAPLNPKWKTGAYEANGGSIREYATQLYTFIQELLSCENVKFNLLDYIYSLRDDIFNNSCKQIPYYANSSYRMLINAGGDSSGGSEIVDETYELKVNNGACSSVDGTISPSTTRLFSNYIAINSSTVSISKNTSAFVLILRYFDKDKNFISAYKGNYASTLTDSAVPSNTKYVVLHMSKSNNTDTITDSDVSGAMTINGKKYNLVYDSTLSLSSSTTTTTYSITNNLTNVTNNNSDTNVAEGGSYTATLTANSGYELGSVTITMGGSDITSTSYSNGSINISNVTGNIVITANATLIQTTNLVLSETSISINKGDTKQLTATLNGVNVTSSTNWSSDNANATVVGGLVTGVTEGNSIITATKDGESATCSVNIIGEINYLTCTNTGISITGVETPNNTRISTDYIPVTISNETLIVNYSGTYQYALRFYDSSKTCVGRTSGSSFKDPVLGWGIGRETIRESSLTSNVAYVRFLFRADSTGTTEMSSIDGILTVDSVEYTLTM